MNEVDAAYGAASRTLSNEEFSMKEETIQAVLIKKKSDPNTTSDAKAD